MTLLALCTRNLETYSAKNRDRDRARYRAATSDNHRVARVVSTWLAWRVIVFRAYRVTKRIMRSVIRALAVAAGDTGSIGGERVSTTDADVIVDRIELGASNITSREIRVCH